MTKKQLGIFLAGILVLIALVGGIVGHFVGLEQAFQAGLAAALVYATAFYVYLTSRTVEAARQSAEVANRQAEIMLTAEFNAAAPIIKLFASEKEQENITVDWENVGKGPALNLQCWIEDREHPELRMKEISRTAVAEREPDRDTISTNIKGYTLSVGYLRAQYASVFGKTYESCLIFSTNAPPEFKYGQVNQSTMSEPNSGRTSQDSETQLDRIEKAIQRIAFSTCRLAFLSIGFAMVIASVSITAELITRANLPLAELWIRLFVLLGGLIVIILSSYKGK